MTHTWLGPNHRRSLWRTSDGDPVCLGIVYEIDGEWEAHTYAPSTWYGGPVPTRDEAGRALCDHLGIEMPGFDSGEVGDDF